MVTQSVPVSGPSAPPKPINILILGETQNGKSTLIKQLGVYGKKRDNNINIGHGNLSCTTEVGIYPLATKLRTYHLVDRSGRRIRDRKFSDLVDYTDDDAAAAADEPDHDGRVFRFDLIDTPGLDDSDGNDMEIMANIIGRISEVGYLNALLYVRSLDKPFNESFNRFYDYLRRCMPMLFSGLIIAHTRYTVDREDEALAAGRNFKKDRRAAFRKATKCSDDLTHNFMDNDPDPEMPFQVVQSFNSCHALLDLAKSQRPIDVANNVYLLKAPNMIYMDNHVMLALSRLSTGLKERLAKELAAASKSKGQTLRVKRELARLKARLDEFEAELAKLDTNDEIVLGRKTVAEDYTLGTFFMDAKLWLDKRDVSYDSDCIISRVTKTTGSGCRWLDEDTRGTTWRATLKSSILRSINGSATFYTSNRLKHQSEITQLRGRIRDTKEYITNQSDVLGDLDDLGDTDTLAETLQNDVDRCAKTMERVDRDTFDACLWPTLRRFYMSRSQPSTTEIVDFIDVYDPETAKLMVFG
ncbi:hypothetical protein CONLIGDRAFT_617637 [Coniochaeta ligniaria NRRL 30616]|uniref:G domain-containing protein n=1 Tax=Coniochaeta ligniaria NRRL 30616 TaxID=1408157 RepID=A0A1J7J5Y9_9PEZI|nr:hypothetical protein CONLIGDRAFT_617637 [Coniochaeta ligniaria NRRL 30616]